MCVVFGQGTACVPPSTIVRGASRDSIQFVSLVAAGGAVTVGISLNGGVDVVVAESFLYTSITLASIVPSSAPVDGGTLLTVHGSGFLTPGLPTNLARCRYTYQAGYYKPQATTLTMQEDVLVLALRDSLVECEAITICGCGSGDSGSGDAGSGVEAHAARRFIGGGYNARRGCPPFGRSAARMRGEAAGNESSALRLVSAAT